MLLCVVVREYKRKYFGFGEWKPVSGWVSDSRCVVDSDIAYDRILHGWEVERAITVPVKWRRQDARDKQLECFGEVKSLLEWVDDERCVVSFDVLQRRVSRGWDSFRALTQPVGLHNPVFAFGEWKSISGWVSDSRCVVSERELRSRLKDGWNVEDAIVTYSSNVYSAFGVEKPFAEWTKDDRCCVPRGVAYRRFFRLGWPLEDALTVPTAEHDRIVTVDGESKRVSEWCEDERVSVNRTVILDRLVTGWDVTDALFTPLREKASGLEPGFVRFVESLNVDIVKNDKTVLGSHELDVYVPEHKIAFEFNGLYWHSSKFRDRWYHYSKWKKCSDVGVRLFQIWEDDWVERRDITQRMIAAKLGVLDDEKVSARSCDVCVVDNVFERKNFFERNHIQGDRSCSVCVGLRYNDVLVCAASFVRRGDGTSELVRFASSCLVRGGFSRLVKWFREHVFDGVLITFADLCVSDGGLYAGSGWRLDGLVEPSYWYVVDGRRVHKFRFRLKKFRDDPGLLFVDGLSESELAKINGLLRVWDAGKLRFVLD